MLYGAELLAGVEPQQVREFSVAQLLWVHASLQGTELRKTPGLVGSSDPLSQHGCRYWVMTLHSSGLTSVYSGAASRSDRIEQLFRPLETEQANQALHTELDSGCSVFEKG